MERPVIKDFPEAFETRRLLIRSPHPGDGAAKHRALAESAENLRPWIAWAQHEKTPEDSEAAVRRARARFVEREDLQMLLFDKESGELVGGSGLHHMDWEIPKFEIGYWCSTRFEGRGYITEAVRGVASFAFEMLGARRLEIRCHHLNYRSARVARRAGFRLEAELHEDQMSPEGKIGNTLIHAMLADYPERPVDGFSVRP